MIRNLLLLSVFACSMVFGQKTHTVRAKETLFGLSQKYNVSVESLKNFNPILGSQGLQIGQQIFVEDPDFLIQKGYKDDSYYRVVEITKSQTLSQIASKYGFSVKSLVSLNPHLRKASPKEGDLVRVPKTKGSFKGKHLVKSNHTIKGIASAYGRTTDELLAVNPNLAKGLEQGIYLTIPSKSSLSYKDGYILHPSNNQSDLFSILSKYQVGKGQVIKANPSLEDKGLVGSIKVPTGLVSQLEGQRNVIDKAKSNINLLIMLPFFADENALDAKKRRISKLSTDFILGVNVALKQLASEGKKIHFDVTDTKNNQANVLNYLSAYDTKSLDAIIGPLYKSNIEKVADYLKKDKIPVLSPFSTSTSLSNYNNVLVGKTKDEFAAETMLSEMQKDINEGIVYLVVDSKSAKLGNYVRSKILERNSSALVKVISDVSELIPYGDNKISAFLLSDDNPSLADAYVKKIVNLHQGGYPIGANVALGSAKTSPVFKKYKKSLFPIGFSYAMKHLVNERGAKEKAVLARFKKENCVNPNAEMLIGYDTVYDLVSRMDAKGKMWNNVGVKQTHLGTAFQYKKNGKGYANHGVRIIRYKTKAIAN